MIKIWQIGNTGVRNPLRIHEAFRLYAESNLVGVYIRGIYLYAVFSIGTGTKFANNLDSISLMEVFSNELGLCAPRSDTGKVRIVTAISVLEAPCTSYRKSGICIRLFPSRIC